MQGWGEVGRGWGGAMGLACQRSWQFGVLRSIWDTNWVLELSTISNKMSTSLQPAQWLDLLHFNPTIWLIQYANLE